MLPVHRQNALCSSRVNVFSTKVLIEDAIFRLLLEMGPQIYVHIQTMRRSTRLQGKVKAVPSFLIHFKTLSIGLFPARTGLSRQEKKERKERERDLCWPPMADAFPIAHVA